MKKIIKILLILICIGIFILVTLTRYVEKEFDVSSRFGKVLSGGVMSTKEYAMINDAYTIYIDNLKSGDFEKAYTFLSYEYKQYKTLDDFLIENLEKDFSSINVSQIIKRTDRLYSVILTDGEKQFENMILYNPETARCFIIPDTFIEKKILENKIKEKSVEYTIKETVNYLNKYTVDLEISNLSKKDTVIIDDVELILEDGKVKKDGIKGSITIMPETTKNIVVEYDTYIEFPIGINVLRKMNNEKIKTYLIEID